MKKNSFNYPALFLYLIFPVCIFLSFNKHSKDKNNSYHSVIWADAAGYYVYLPMTLLYNSAEDFSSAIPDKTGNGFSIDQVKNVVRTKYSSGVAILQSPFFLLSHLVAKALHDQADGFSKIYQWGIMIAAIFYSCFGMYMVCLFLADSYSKLFSFVLMLSVFLSTNLYYYSIDAVGMSHIYSFFLIAAFILVTQRIYQSFSLARIILLSLLTSLILLIRPINGVTILFFVFFDLRTTEDFKKRITFFRNHFIHLLIIPTVVIIMFIPQLLYWKSISGSWIYDSYPGESFSFWKSPQIIKEWLSTNNGLFIYAPVMVLSFIGLIKMIRSSVANGILISFIFLLMSYILGSWWNWWFGCSYGARSFVEFYPLLIIPIAMLLHTEKKMWRRNLYATSVLLCIIINMNIIYYYDGCFYGGDWDWNAYLQLHLK